MLIIGVAFGWVRYGIDFSTLYLTLIIPIIECYYLKLCNATTI